MAWPLTPRTTYIADSTPAIKADDLNALQEGVNRALLGTYSYAGLVVDGAGGAPVAPDPGSLRASGIVSVGASAARNAAPTPVIIKGAVYRESCLLAFALIDPAAPGNLRYGFNIKLVGYANPGLPIAAWIVELATPGTPQTMMACAFGTGGPDGTVANAEVLSPSGVIQIRTFANGQPAVSQRPCGVVVFGA